MLIDKVNDNIVLHYSYEFNGDMGYTNKGSLVLEGLRYVDNYGDFSRFVDYFNKKEFGYPEGSFVDSYIIEDLTIRDEDLHKEFLADYKYLKNISGSEITIETRDSSKLKIDNNEIKVLSYGGEWASDISTLEDYIKGRKVYL